MKENLSERIRSEEVTADKGVSPDAAFKTRRFLLALSKETRAVLFANVNNCHETNPWRDSREQKLRWGEFFRERLQLKTFPRAV